MVSASARSGISGSDRVAQRGFLWVMHEVSPILLLPPSPCPAPRLLSSHLLLLLLLLLFFLLLLILLLLFVFFYFFDVCPSPDRRHRRRRRRRHRRLCLSFLSFFLSSFLATLALPFSSSHASVFSQAGAPCESLYRLSLFGFEPIPSAHGSLFSTSLPRCPFYRTGSYGFSMRGRTTDIGRLITYLRGGPHRPRR